jgi:murein DD-endopeptidase MepM/ murein hydrolase activator NlpD
MTPRRAPTYLALIVAMLVALIAPAAIADDAIPPEGEPPTTTTVPASTTTTTSIPPTTTTTTTVVAEPPPAVTPPTDDEEPPVPPEAAPEPPPPAETPIEPESPPGDGEPAETEEEEIEFDPLDPEQVTRDIVFPVVGASTFSKGFGDCRDGCRRSHNGIDILTHRWKGSPVVAAHDGRVTLTRTGGKLSGCAVVLKAEDGWTSHYVHLNTDILGTDSEADLCFAPGIEVGAEVTEGTILGWIGDSGNAEHTQPHLHFEIRNPDGIPVDSWYSLKEARRIEYSLIDAADLVLLGTALFGDDASTAFVIDVADLFDAAEASTTSYESPLIPLDPEAPSEAFIALASIEPERIIVFTDNDEAGYLEELRRIAPIVEVSEVLLPRDVSEEEQIDADGDVVEVLDDGVVLDTAPLEETDPDEEQADEPIYMYEAEEPSTIVVVAGDDPRTMDELMERYEHLLGFVSPNDIPGDLGFSVGSHPGVEANRSAFWWQTADGWALTEELPADRPLSIAVVRDPEDEATLNFLVSLSVSPSIPLWHHQPTSPTIKSL